MKVLVVLSAMLSAVAAAPSRPIVVPDLPVAVHAAPVAVVTSQSHAQDELGQYTYSYSNPHSSKVETKTVDGITRGGYSYLDSHGLVQNVNYVSDDVNGFRVAASNLPLGRVTPQEDEPHVAHEKAKAVAALHNAALQDAVEAAVAHNSEVPLVPVAVETPVAPVAYISSSTPGPLPGVSPVVHVTHAPPASGSYHDHPHSYATVEVDSSDIPAPELSPGSFFRPYHAVVVSSTPAPTVYEEVASIKIESVPSPTPLAHSIPNSLAHAYPARYVHGPAPVVRVGPAPIVHTTPAPAYHEEHVPSVYASPLPLVHNAHDSLAPSHYEAHTPVVHVTPVPVHHESPTPVVHAVPTPVVHATPTPVYHEVPTPVVHASAPHYETYHKVPTPVFHTAPAHHENYHEVSTPVVHATPAPVYHEVPTPVVHASAPRYEAYHEVPTPVVHATAAPVYHEVPTPVVHAAPAHYEDYHEVPTPVVHATPAPVYHEVPTPVSHASPAPLYHKIHATPDPIYHEAPAPVVHAVPTPVVHATAAPIYHEAPTPVVHESPASIPVIHDVPNPIVHEAPVVHAAPVAVVTSQSHAQDELGQYSYSYSNPLSSKVETKTVDGVTRGGYSYLDSHGHVQNVNYVSDDHHGFRVAASNLPSAAVPVDIPDSHDVAAAKAVFFAEIAKARAAVHHH